MEDISRKKVTNEVESRRRKMLEVYVALERKRTAIGSAI